jgi:hypothetical protein
MIGYQQIKMAIREWQSEKVSLKNIIRPWVEVTSDVFLRLCILHEPGKIDFWCEMQHALARDK